MRQTNRKQFMWQNTGRVYIQFILDLHVLSDHSDTFDSNPLAYNTLPPNDGTADPSVSLNFTATQHSGVFLTSPLFNNTVLPDTNIWPYDWFIVYFGRRVLGNF